MLNELSLVIDGKLGVGGHSITRFISADRSAVLALLRSALPYLLFVLLAIYNAFRLFRHAMWRDELQSFMIAVTSATPLEVLDKCKYEGHPALWYLLLWVITRLTSDPLGMQVAHLLIALGIWMLIWRMSPFRPLEKLLLITSYFLFWEYFIISRGYALMVLLGFSFVTLHVSRPGQRFWPWVLLGLLANTELFGAIWSLGLGVFFALQKRHEWRSLIPGAALYVALLAFAVAIMVPAPDYDFGPSTPRLVLSQLDAPLYFVLNAFFPFFYPFTNDVLRAIGGSAQLAATFGVQLSTQLTSLIGDNPILAFIVLALPILACWSIMRDAMRTAQYVAVFIGVLLFAQLWLFAGAPRHHGILFIALVGSVWMWRSAISRTRPLAPVWIALLAFNALGGLTTIASDWRPFSQGSNVATWLQRQHLDDELLIANHVGLSVAGYLRRPLYYTECECFGTYIVWNRKRKSNLNLEDLVTRVDRIMKTENKDEAYLILNYRDQLEGQRVVPNLAFNATQDFTNAVIGDETYVIYRVTRKAGEF